jgi:hypothetical protein
VEHRQVEARQTTAYRSSGDDPARFLQELRQLRDGAGLGPAELAARAHYPYDRIRAAEAGPTLPDLPVLSAYVRGCGGTTEEWEERWRSLTSAPTLPLLAARPAGSSTAASAGARIGSISPASDNPDPSIILAALDRVAEGMAVGNPAPAPEPTPAPAPAPQSGVSTIERTGWETDAAASGGQTEQTADVVESADGGGAVTGSEAAGAAGAAGAEAAAPDAGAGVTPARPAVAPTIAGTAPPTASATASPALATAAAPALAARASAARASAARAMPKVAGVQAKAGVSTAVPGRVASGSTGPTLSRTKILAAIAVVICVLLAALAIFG